MKTTAAFQAIAALDLNPIKIKLMHAASGEGWSQARADAIELEYRRFLYLMHTFPQEELAPTVDVDTFWHYHILDTMKYAADCEQAFGYFLHHYPYVGLDTAEDDGAEERGGNRMRQLYEQTFGEDYIRAEAYGGEAAYCMYRPTRVEASDVAYCMYRPTRGEAAKGAEGAYCMYRPTRKEASQSAYCMYRPTRKEASETAYCMYRPTRKEASATAYCMYRPTRTEASAAAYCMYRPTRKNAAEAAYCMYRPTRGDDDGARVTPQLAAMQPVIPQLLA